ncbi:zinc finger and BTB domain-containing protein 21 [Lepeophtheirus salmonis]|nr:zinc finger protein 865-like [Lepeophtheirus salmonis]
MHQFVTLSRGDATTSGGEEEEVVHYEDHDTSTTTLITTAPGTTVNMNSLGSHFLTDPDDLEQSIGKIEVETMPIEVVVKKKEGSDGEKKVCLWPIGGGISCGKTFTKFDNLKRHLAEAHKGSRPFACNLCDKSYGRKDYLQRHLKSHAVASNFSINMSSHQSTPTVITTTTSASNLAPNSVQHLSDVISKVQMTNPKQNILVQLQPNNVSPHIVTTPITQTISPQQAQSQQQNPLPMFNVQLTGGSITKPGGSKICRWVQNDGTVCGKAFSKLDSLRRHVTELHKGVRPYACNLCDKNYGRRDYLERHMRTHDANNANKRKAGPIDWGPNSSVQVITSGGVLSSDQIVQRIPKKKRKDIPAEEKKICLWVLEDGTACGKTFTKFDSLKRHVSEAHKGIRPYACTLCGKNYGRRDYLLRHLKSHNETDTVGISATRAPATQLVSQVVGTNNTLNFAPSGVQQTTVLQQVAAVVSSPQLVRTVTSQTPQLVSLENNAPTTVTFTTSPVQPTSGTNGTQSITQTLVTSPKKRNDDKKTCRWVLENGTVCGRNFSKFDSLRRHVQELHKGIRPFVCSLCDKSYGRRDYLQRHMKSHDNDSIAGAINVSSPGPATVVVTQ